MRIQVTLGKAGPPADATGPASPSLPRGWVAYTMKTVREIGVGPLLRRHDARCDSKRNAAGLCCTPQEDAPAYIQGLANELISLGEFC